MSLALVALGERYWALGLIAAARGAFERAHAAADPKDATAAVRLAELALAVGDGRAARVHAQDVVKRYPGAEARTLLGRAQLAAGEIAAARMSFAVAIDTPSIPPMVRARARLGMCRAATVLGDAPGAAANAAAAFDDLIAGVFRRTAAAPTRRPRSPRPAPRTPTARRKSTPRLGRRRRRIRPAHVRVRSGWSARCSPLPAPRTAIPRSATRMPTPRSRPRPPRTRARSRSGCARSSAARCARGSIPRRAPSCCASSTR